MKEQVQNDTESFAVQQESDREKALEFLHETMTEEALWNCITAFQEYPFHTASGLPFHYTLKKGRNGKLTHELWIDRREGSKSLTWSSVRLAFQNVEEMRKNMIEMRQSSGKSEKKGCPFVERPKGLGDIRGVSYIYPLFLRFGLIEVPEKFQGKMIYQQLELPRTLLHGE